MGCVTKWQHVYHMDHLDVFGTHVKVPSIKHHDTFWFMAKLYCDVLFVIDVHITLLRGRIVLRCTVCWHYIEYIIFINIHGCCFMTFSIRCSWIIYRSISFCWNLYYLLCHESHPCAFSWFMISQDHPVFKTCTSNINLDRHNLASSSGGHGPGGYH